MSLLTALAGIAYLVGFIWLVVLGFKKSVWWGLGNLLVPFVALIFGIIHWAEAKTPLLLYVISGFVWGYGWARTHSLGM